MDVVAILMSSGKTVSTPNHNFDQKNKQTWNNPVLFRRIDKLELDNPVSEAFSCV